MNVRTKGIGLFSGGLDSILAVKVLQEQGIEVVGYTFITPFFGPESALRARDKLDIRLEIMEITDVYMENVLKHPRYGYGKNMNPCIDCHAFMFRLAGERMKDEGAHFLFSGEVLGERPFSQNRNSLRAVANLSGYADHILRPLSARLLEETSAEAEGKVDRNRLLDIQGRSRKRQMELAQNFGITDYPKPAGGCLLTEPNFSKRLKELFQYTPDPGARDLELLKVGRHFRWNEDVKIIVGRRQEENQRLEDLWERGDVRLWVKEIPGPVVFLPASPSPSREALLFAAQLAVRYSGVPPDQEMAVSYTDGSQQGDLHVAACSEAEIRGRIL